MKILITLITVMIVAAGCNKETTEPNNSSISVIGPWRGNALGRYSVLYNRPNGTASLFYMNGGIDTATAEGKLVGSYTYANNSYSGRFTSPTDTAYLELSSVTPNRLSGLYSINAGPVGYTELIRLY